MKLGLSRGFLIVSFFLLFTLNLWFSPKDVDAHIYFIFIKCFYDTFDKLMIQTVECCLLMDQALYIFPNACD